MRIYCGVVAFFLCVLVLGIQCQLIDYCIIGAGPAGLLAGHLLKGRNFKIFEKESVPGSFFQHFPRQGVLNSWRDLLTLHSDFPFSSQDLYPNRTEYMMYLSEFSQGLPILYDTKVLNIVKTGNFHLLTTNSNFECTKVIVVTGLPIDHIPFHGKGHEFIEYYSKVSNNPQNFKNQSILIIGKGNSAFEMAQMLSPVSKVVHLISRNRIRFAFETHYFGHVHSRNNHLLDHYQLKSLDAIGELDLFEYEIIKRNGKLYLENAGVREDYGKTMFPFEYDRIISCAGFDANTSIFKSLNVEFDAKYPKLNEFYESNVANLFFAGSLMHGRDYKISSGGFIHGWRWLIQVMIQHMTKSFVAHSILDLNQYLTNRNKTGIWDMYGILHDVIDFSKEPYQVHQDVPIASRQFESSHYLTFSIQYHSDKMVPRLEEYKDYKLIWTRICPSIEKCNFVK